MLQARVSAAGPHLFIDFEGLSSLGVDLGVPEPERQIGPTVERADLFRGPTGQINISKDPLGHCGSKF